MRLPVTLTSDFICPWCFIGERKLAVAIKALPADWHIEVAYRPFELNPDMPPEGWDRKAYRSAKFGSWARAQALDERVAAAGRAEGLTFNYDRMTRTPNTMLAHRLTWLAGQDEADQAGLAHHLFTAYFTEGLDVSDPTVLRRLASEAGLTGDRITAVLDGDLGLAEVQALTEDAYRKGIQGVPLFEIGAVAISGAQPAAMIEDALRRAAEAQVPA
jgi:predicted DsbA family dithiol-disulfide isomerase